MYLKINFLGLNELALFLWKQNTVQRKKPQISKHYWKFVTIWRERPHSKMAVLPHDNGSKAQMLPLPKQWIPRGLAAPSWSASPTCQDASAPWVTLGTTTVPRGWPTSGVGSAAAYPLVATAASPGFDSASSRSKRPRLCLGTLVLALDLPLGFLYSCSIITVVNWPQIQWHPDDPAAGLGRVQVQLPFTSLGHF